MRPDLQEKLWAALAAEPDSDKRKIIAAIEIIEAELHDIAVDIAHAIDKEGGFSKRKLRDQFAMAAVHGLTRGFSIHNQDMPELCATKAYDIADAMLKARERNAQS